MFSMSDESDKKLFWTTLPGILTAIAALIAALTGFFHAYPDSNPFGPGGNGSEQKIGSSLNQVGRLNCNFPSLRYIISMRFFVVLKPLALLFAD